MMAVTASGSVTAMVKEGQGSLDPDSITEMMQVWTLVSLHWDSSYCVPQHTYSPSSSLLEISVYSAAPSWLISTWLTHWLCAKVPALSAGDPAIVTRSSHIGNLKIGFLLPTLLDTWLFWLYRIGAGTGWPHISLLWWSEIACLICNPCLTVKAGNLPSRRVLLNQGQEADLSLKCTLPVEGTFTLPGNHSISLLLSLVDSTCSLAVGNNQNDNTMLHYVRW